MNVFYDHLVNIHELHIELDRFDLGNAERNELMALADSTIHHEIFDLLMVELPQEHKVFFLERFATDPSDPALLAFLKTHVPGVEARIAERAKKVKNEFREKMRRVKRA